MHLEKEVQVAAPPSTVWSVLQDIGKWGEWTATVKSIEVLDDGPLRTGQRAKIALAGAPAGTWTVTEVHDGGSFTWTANLRGVKTLAGHVIVPSGDGTRVRLTLDMSGIGAVLFRPMIKRNSLRNLEIESAGLKRRAEELARRR